MKKRLIVVLAVLLIPLILTLLAPTPNAAMQQVHFLQINPLTGPAASMARAVLTEQRLRQRASIMPGASLTTVATNTRSSLVSGTWAALQRRTLSPGYVVRRLTIGACGAGDHQLRRLSFHGAHSRGDEGAYHWNRECRPG